VTSTRWARLLTAVLTLSVPHMASAGDEAFPVPAIGFAPRMYVCPPCGEPPVIDGRLDDAAWADAPWTEAFLDIEGPDKRPPRHLTRAKMVWDAEALYVGARLDEPHVWGTLTERDAVIYHDNDFEVFIDPDGDNHLYYELEINALGTEWDLLLIRPYRDGAPAVDAWDITGLRTAVHVEGTLNDPSDTDTAWTVEIALPWDVLEEATDRPAPPAPGDVWRINFSRVQWRAEIVDGAYRKLTDPATGRALPEDNWVWSPQGLIAMHYPEMWGEVLFAGPDGGDFRGNADHERIGIAAQLMPVYYRQQRHRQAQGAYAATLDELGVPARTLPAWPGAGTAWSDLPANWDLTLTGDGRTFRAYLRTPQGAAAVDETGRLEWLP
jgi:hypothetical protein